MEVLNAKHPYVGIRYNTTGRYGYSFRKDDVEVLNLCAPVLPHPDVRIWGFGLDLHHRDFDPGLTLVPGIRRSLLDAQGAVDGYYEFITPTKFRIVTKAGKLHVTTSGGGWFISDENEDIAVLLRLKEEKRRHFEEKGCEMEERCQLFLMQKIKEAQLAYIMAIPMLGF